MTRISASCGVDGDWLHVKNCGIDPDLPVPGESVGQREAEFWGAIIGY